MLTAVQEVDNAMVNYKGAVKQLNVLYDLVEQGKITLNLSLDLYKRGLSTFQNVLNQGVETLKLSLELYKQGLSPFQNVLDAQRSLLDYQNGLVSAQGAALSAVIDLYRALGGGWDNGSSE
mgnify:CR=1 FL=1